MQRSSPQCYLQKGFPDPAEAWEPQPGHMLSPGCLTPAPKSPTLLCALLTMSHGSLCRDSHGTGIPHRLPSARPVGTARARTLPSLLYNKDRVPVPCWVPTPLTNKGSVTVSAHLSRRSFLSTGSFPAALKCIPVSPSFKQPALTPGATHVSVTLHSKNHETAALF